MEESWESVNGLKKYWVVLLNNYKEENSRLVKTLKQFKIREIARQGIFGHLSVTKIVEKLELVQEEVRQLRVKVVALSSNVGEEQCLTAQAYIKREKG